MRTVYCISFEDAAGGGVAWYGTANARDAALGTMTGTNERSFETEVPVTATDDEVTDLVDAVAWEVA